MSVALVGSVSGCDFGTLDSLSEEGTEDGTQEITETSQAIWNTYERGNDGAVKRALAGVPDAIDRAGTLPIKVKIGDLTQDDLDVISKMGDPAAPQGMLLVADLDCTLDQVEKLVVANNQTTLYPDLYDDYKRTYTSSIQDYLSRKTSKVFWHTDYTASAVGKTYVAGLTGSARRVPDANPKGGDVIMSRTVLDQPANFIKGDDAEFNQDYQIELYFEIQPGKVRHFYALWRQFRIGGLDAESDLYVNLVLGNLEDFDTRTSKICRDNAPVAAFQ